VEGSTETGLERIVKLLPAAWQFPHIAVARIVLDERCYSVGDLESARFRQSERIVVDGKDRGVVEVGYVAEIPEFVEGPFLPEEQELLRAVAQEIVEFVEKDRATKLRARLEEQVRHADRLATIGQLSAGIAHEINEPLAAILGCAQLARKAQNLSAETITDLDDIIAASLHAREVVSKLMLFARERPPRKTLVNISEVVRQGLSILEARCAKEGVEMVQDLADDLPPVLADPAQLQQVLVNLVVNALQAMPEGGTVTIATCGDEKSAALVVEDTGVGMSDEVRKQIFDPFFTTKDVGQGTGLGLSVVHGIVTSHRGTIECQSKLGHGSRFEVRFPRSTPQDLNGQEEYVSE
jgi:signal transduction histidine kinase